MNLNRKILVIDDEAQIRELLRQSICHEGYEVETAEDGYDGWEYFKREFFPVVVTDLKMPEIDGLKLLENIKNVHPETQVIMITGYGGKNDIIRSLQLDAFDYIEKGGSEMLQNLLNAIENAFQKYEVEAQKMDFTTILSDLNIDQPMLSIDEIREIMRQLPPVSETLIRERRGN